MFQSFKLSENLVVGGVTYVATSNDWAAGFFNDVNGTAGVPFQAFIGGVAGQLIYDILFTGGGAGAVNTRIGTAMYTGMGAMVGAVAATIVGGSAAAPVGAALGSVYFKFGGGNAGAYL